MIHYGFNEILESIPLPWFPIVYQFGIKDTNTKVNTKYSVIVFQPHPLSGESWPLWNMKQATALNGLRVDVRGFFANLGVHRGQANWGNDNKKAFVGASLLCSIVLRFHKRRHFSPDIYCRFLLPHTPVNVVVAKLYHKPSVVRGNEPFTLPLTWTWIQEDGSKWETLTHTFKNLPSGARAFPSRQASLTVSYIASSPWWTTGETPLNTRMARRGQKNLPPMGFSTTVAGLNPRFTPFAITEPRSYAGPCTARHMPSAPVSGEPHFLDIRTVENDLSTQDLIGLAIVGLFLCVLRCPVIDIIHRSEIFR